MAAGEVSKYAMESAYKDVERDALTRTEAKDNPKAIVLGGQPGSGKSALAAEAAREFRGNGGAVVIDADRMREENPRYKQLSKEDPQNAADRTHKEAGEWATRLTMAAVEGRRNLVVDGTMRSPENIRELTNRLKENGYEVEARVMAVNPETSMTRARLRFEEQVAERGTGRFVNREQHDAANTGMVESVRSLVPEKLAQTQRH
jgi:predicted ABC-type ATPase